MRSLCYIPLILIFALLSNGAAHAQVPAGFNLVKSGPGVGVYRKDYKGGKPDWVTVVNLEAGTFRSLTGEVSGKPNAKIARKPIADFWGDAQWFRTDRRTPATVINGTFFDTADLLNRERWTTLGFGLKVDGSVYSYGSKPTSYGDRVKLLMFNGLEARIYDYSRGILEDTRWPNGIGAHTLSQPFPGDDNEKHYEPKSQIAIKDSDGNGTYETIMIFSSLNARKKDAARILEGFGANTANILQLDAGNSAGLIIDGTRIYSSLTGRPVPHALASFAGREWPEGQLLREQGRPEVYQILGGARMHVPSIEDFNALGFRWDRVLNVSPGSATAVPKYPRFGTMFRAWNRPEVFVIERSAVGLPCKKWIHSEATVNRYGGWGKVILIGDGGANDIPYGGILP